MEQNQLQVIRKADIFADGPLKNLAEKCLTFNKDTGELIEEFDIQIQKDETREELMQQAAAMKPPVDYVKEQNLQRWADSLEEYDKQKEKLMPNT